MKQDLDAMVQQGVIDSETALRIDSWYRTRAAVPAGTRLTLVFSVLGSLLVVTGILLVVAHNWDQFSRPVKVLLAFLPMILGQAATGYTLLKKREHAAWREVSGSWLALSVGIAIAVISQIYHLPGTLDNFLLSWLMLGGLLMYILPASVVALLFLAGTTWYAVEAGYTWSSTASVWTGWPYWVLLAAVVPHYVQVVRAAPNGFFSQLFHFCFALSLPIGLGMYIGGPGSGWLWPGYMSMFGAMLLAGLWLQKKPAAKKWNGYYVTGWLGTLGLLIAGTFRDFWKEIADGNSFELNDNGWLPLAIAIGISCFGLILLYFQCIQNPQSKGWYPPAIAFLFFWAMLAVASFSPGVATIITNGYLLAIGIWLLYRGNLQHSFARLNAGLGIIAILAVARFFDTDLSFVLRGVIFIAVGLGFVLANYQLIQKKRNHA